MKEEYQAQVEWRPFELRPGMPAEGMESPYPPEQREQRFARIRQMAEEAGLTMHPPRRISNPRLAFEATEFARAQGQFDALHRAILDAYWRDGQDIGQLSVLLGLAQRVGLDTEALATALKEGSYRESVERLLEESRSIGIRAVPSYVFQDKYLLEGAQPYEVFRNFVEQHLKGQGGV